MDSKNENALGAELAAAPPILDVAESETASEMSPAVMKTMMRFWQRMSKVLGADNARLRRLVVLGVEGWGHAELAEAEQIATEARQLEAELLADDQAAAEVSSTPTASPAQESPADITTELLEALKKAKQTIRDWHGEIAWDHYQSSPEMKAINAALAKAERQPR